MAQAAGFVCVGCTKSFATKQTLQRHQANPERCAKRVNGRERKVISCPCGSTFANDWNLTRHRVKCKAEKPNIALVPEQKDPEQQAPISEHVAKGLREEVENLREMLLAMHRQINGAPATAAIAGPAMAITMASDIPAPSDILSAGVASVTDVTTASCSAASSSVTSDVPASSAVAAADPEMKEFEPRGSGGVSIESIVNNSGSITVNNVVQNINVYGSENIAMISVERLRDLTRECADFRELGMKVIEIIYDDISNQNAYIPNVKLPQNAKVLRGDPKRWELQPTSEVAEHMAKVAGAALKTVNSHSVAVAIMFDNKMTQFQDARHYVVGNEKKFAEANLARIRDQLIKNRPK